MVQYTANFLKLYTNICEMCDHRNDDDHDYEQETEESTTTG